MKKAVVHIGGRQHIVVEGDEIEVNRLEDRKSYVFEPLMVIDGAKSLVGTPTVKDVLVKAELVEQDIKQDKVVAIRYKAKKRVHKRRGHRQTSTRIKITKIA